MDAPNVGVYVEWRPPAPLARYVDCTFTSAVGLSTTGPAEPILPDGCMDIIWDGAHLFLSGPGTRPDWSGPTAPTVIGLRFRPGAGPLFLRVPAERVRDQRLDLVELWCESDELAERLSACSDPSGCAEILAEAAAQRLASLQAADPLVEAAVRAWSTSAQSLSAADLSALAGITPRQVHRRFLSSIGYGPKLLQRVLRFQAFLRACSDRKLGLAELALGSGYADQAHLTREARLLAGVTPAHLRAARRDVRNVQDSRAGSEVHRLYGTDPDEDPAAQRGRHR